AGAGASDDVGAAVAVEVPRGYMHAARKRRTICKKVAQERAIGDLGVRLQLSEFGAVDDLDLRAAARACAGDDVDVAVHVDIGHGDVDTAGEPGAVSEEAAQEGAIGNFPVGLGLSVHHAVDHFDMRSAAATCSGNQVQVRVAVEIADSDVDAAQEVRGKREKAREEGAVGDLAVGLELVELGTVDHFDLGPTPWTGRDDDVANAIAV